MSSGQLITTCASRKIQVIVFSSRVEDDEFSSDDDAPLIKKLKSLNRTTFPEMALKGTVLNKFINFRFFV